MWFSEVHYEMVIHNLNLYSILCTYNLPENVPEKHTKHAQLSKSANRSE